MDNPDGIQLAQPADEDELWELLKRLHEEIGIFETSEGKVRQFLKLATHQQGGIIGLIRGDDGSIEASIGLVIQQFWYTDDWSLMEHWMFVAPEHRKSTHAQRLLSYAKWCGQQLGVPVLLGIMTAKNAEAKEKLYGRKFQRLGSIYIHLNTDGNGHV